MTMQADTDTNRRPKGRRFGFWSGVLATLGLLIGLGVLGAVVSDRPWGDHIATVHIAGVIFDDAHRDEVLQDIKEAETARALIVRINSPGGTTAGSEALYEHLRAIAAEKPVVAVLREVAASGGYITALGADHIIARGNTATGSIGVILEYPNLTGLMDRIGIAVETVRSSALKAEGSPFRDISPEGRAAEQALIDDGYQWFRGLVAERRALSGAALDEVADGRAFSGRQALDMGLIDALGGVKEAQEYLESLPGIPENLETVTYGIEREPGLAGLVLGKFLSTNSALGHISSPQGPRLYSIAR